MPLLKNKWTVITSELQYPDYQHTTKSTGKSEVVHKKSFKALVKLQRHPLLTATLE